MSIESAVTNKKEAETSAKRKYIIYLIYKWANTAFWQRYEKPVRKQEMPSLPGSR